MIIVNLNHGVGMRANKEEDESLGYISTRVYGHL